MEFMWRCPGCSGKYRKLPHTCLVPDPVVLVFVCWPPNAPNCSAEWPRAHLPNKTPIVPRSSCVSRPIRPTSRSRTRWVWPYARSLSGAIASPSIAWTASKTVQSARRPASTQARLLVLACQKPSEVDPTRAGQTHWSINDLAQYVAAHPELGLGSPSKSTIGVILKRHQVRLDRLDTWMNDRDPNFAEKAV